VCVCVCVRVCVSACVLGSHVCSEHSVSAAGPWLACRRQGNVAHVTDVNVRYDSFHFSRCWIEVLDVMSCTELTENWCCQHR